MKRKIFSILMCAIMIFNLTACGSKGLSNDASLFAEFLKENVFNDNKVVYGIFIDLNKDNIPELIYKIGENGESIALAKIVGDKVVSTDLFNYGVLDIAYNAGNKTYEWVLQVREEEETHYYNVEEMDDDGELPEIEDFEDDYVMGDIEIEFEEIHEDTIEKDLGSLYEEVKDDSVYLTEEKKEEIEEEANREPYTSGITDIKKALWYELGLYFNDKNERIAYSLYTIDFNDGLEELYAKDFPDAYVSDFIEFYLSSDNYQQFYTEDEVKKALSDLFGTNYVYDHKIDAFADEEYFSCSGLRYVEEENAYGFFGGCGDINPPSDPHYYMKILEQTEDTVTFASVYVVPTVGPDYEDIAPYYIYSDREKTNQLGKVNAESEAFTTLLDKANKYVVTFDVEDGYYHFNNVKKVK